MKDFTIVILILLLITGCMLAWGIGQVRDDIEELRADINGLRTKVVGVRDEVFKLKLDLIPIEIATDQKKNLLGEIKELIKENREKDTAYRNKVVDVENYNILYFDNLLKDIKLSVLNKKD